MGILIKLFITSLAIYVAARLLPGIEITSMPTLLVVAIVLGLVNTLLKPILIVLTFPLTVITLGLFLLVLNGLLVMLVGAVVPGFQVDSLLSAILFSIVVSLISSILSKLA